MLKKDWYKDYNILTYVVVIGHHVSIASHVRSHGSIIAILQKNIHVIWLIIYMVHCINRENLPKKMEIGSTVYSYCFIKEIKKGIFFHASEPSLLTSELETCFYQKVHVFLLHWLSFWIRNVIENPCLDHF